MDGALRFLRRWTPSIDRLAEALRELGYDVRVTKTEKSVLIQVLSGDKGEHPSFFAIAYVGSEIVSKWRCELPQKVDSPLRLSLLGRLMVIVKSIIDKLS